MPLFAMMLFDKPGALALRLATREAHLAFMAGHKGATKLAGPLLAENGDMAGSLIIVEAEDLAAAQAMNAADPYTQAGLWARTEIRPFRATIGTL